MAIGTSGNQFKCAPVVGKLMTELIEYTQNTNNDHDKNPLEFKLKFLKNDSINTSFFSRLRSVNSTSNTVFG